MVATRTVFLIIVCNVLLASAVQAQHDLCDHNTLLEFYWAPARGKVDHYNVYLSVDDGSYHKVGETPNAPTRDAPYPLPIVAKYGRKYRIAVEAEAADGGVGPMSEPSDPVWCMLTQIQWNMTLGWNFVSTPTRLTNSALEWVLRSIAGSYDSVLTYDPTNGRWGRYHTADGPDFLNDLTTIEQGRGYLINVIALPAVVTLDIVEIANNPIELELGWNLIGYNSLTPRLIEDVLLSIDGNYNSVWTYDPANDEWKRYVAGGPEDLNDLETMEPGKAYWIDVTVKCSIPALGWIEFLKVARH
jgi:hypothetical protein